MQAVFCPFPPGNISMEHPCLCEHQHILPASFLHSCFAFKRSLLWAGEGEDHLHCNRNVDPRLGHCEIAAALLLKLVNQNTLKNEKITTAMSEGPLLLKKFSRQWLKFDVDLLQQPNAKRVCPHAKL